MECALLSMGFGEIYTTSTQAKSGVFMDYISDGMQMTTEMAMSRAEAMRRIDNLSHQEMQEGADGK